MVKRYINAGAPMLVALALSALAVFNVRGVGNLGWLFTADSFPSFFKTFTFSHVGPVDTWIVVGPCFVGVLLFALGLFRSITSEERRGLIPGLILSFLVLVWCTYVYSAAPTPIGAFPGIMCYLSILFALGSQFSFLGGVK